jgi:hypothetical protein
MLTFQPPQTWSEEDAVDAEMIEQYKAWWAKHGFPDVDLQNGAHIKNGNLNDPNFSPTPEALLWSCVLSEAFVDLELGRKLNPSAAHAKLAAEAWNWFDSPSNQPGSFRWVCDSLGFDVAYIRKKALSGAPVKRVGRRYAVKEAA